jgi:hypothetical protein
MRELEALIGVCRARPRSHAKKRRIWYLLTVALRTCTVSFKDVRGIRHSADVEAESLYEAVVLAVRRFRQDPWMEQVGNATVLDVEVREPPTMHSISFQQVERWLAGGASNATEAMKKAKLKTILVQS